MSGPKIAALTLKKSDAMTKSPITRPHDHLTAEERRELPDSAFGIPELREFPLTNAAHVRSAESYFRYADDAHKPELARRILAAAEKFGVEVRSHTICSWAGEEP